MRLIKARALAILMTFWKPELLTFLEARIADFLEGRINVETGEIAYGSGRPDQIARVAQGCTGMCYAPYIFDAAEAPLKRHI